MVLQIAVIISLFLFVSAHPSLYPDVKLDELQSQGIWPPPFRSFHIHCLFVAYDPAQVEKAAALRQRFIQQFKLEDVKPCTGLFHQGRLCMFGLEKDSKGDPFVSGDWSAFVPLEDFYRCASWIMQNRGDLDILVHPNSGAEKHDHSVWCLWGGRIWPINMSAFSSVNATQPAN